jgi:retron-type reverse transcriptase
MRLIRLIVDSSPEEACLRDEHGLRYFPGDDLWTPTERRKGIPLGNLTSQFFANLYLNDFDHFAKEVLGVRGYIRYMDDFSFFSDDKRRLWEIRDRCHAFLAQERLKLHPRKTRIYRTDEGIEFVGFRVFKDRVRIRREAVLRFTRRLRRQQRLYAGGDITPSEIKQSLVGWLGHARYADSRRLCRDILRDVRFVKVQG